MATSLSQAVVEMPTISEEEMVYLGLHASHCCPNCDGPITNGEHEYFGICAHCHFPPITSLH